MDGSACDLAGAAVVFGRPPKKNHSPPGSTGALPSCPVVAIQKTLKFHFTGAEIQELIGGPQERLEKMILAVVRDFPGTLHHSAATAMSLPASSPRPPRSPSEQVRPPFRVVLPETEAIPRPASEESSRQAGDFPLVIADTPEVTVPEQDDLVLPESPVEPSGSESEPRGLVILEQVLGRRDKRGRPQTFGRRLRHRLFGLALGLTIVSGAGLIIGFLGDIDQNLLTLPGEIESLGTSAIPDLGESFPPVVRDTVSEMGAPDDEEATSLEQAADAAERRAVESGETEGVWFEGAIETEAAPENLPQ